LWKKLGRGYDQDDDDNNNNEDEILQSEWCGEKLECSQQICSPYLSKSLTVANHRF